MRFDISALFNPKARPLLGMDISSSAVKLVELTANGKEGYRVERYTIEVLPKDAVSDGNIANLDGVVDAVKRAWKRLGTSTRNVAMAEESNLAQLRVGDAELHQSRSHGVTRAMRTSTGTGPTRFRCCPVPWLPPAGGIGEATMCSSPSPVQTPQS